MTTAHYCPSCCSCWPAASVAVTWGTCSQSMSVSVHPTCHPSFSSTPSVCRPLLWTCPTSAEQHSVCVLGPPAVHSTHTQTYLGMDQQLATLLLAHHKIIPSVLLTCQYCYLSTVLSISFLVKTDEKYLCLTINNWQTQTTFLKTNNHPYSVINVINVINVTITNKVNKVSWGDWSM